MNMRQLPLRLIAAATLCALAGAPALAQTSTTSQETVRLGSQFTTFAGSDSNAQALVQGLRDGTAVTLDSTATGGTTTATTFTPDTGKLGYGNVRIALSLAEASLSKAGITDPTPAEIEAALNGGSLVLADGTTINLDGVLAARAAGEGWGQIANSMGFKLGDVMRSPHAAGHGAAGAHANGEAVAKVDFAKNIAANHPDATDHGGRPDFSQRPDFANRPTRPDIPSRPNLPERPDIPSHAGRPGG
ncbi:hypothetical protein [Dyella sp. A6]|uniref:hypothetical protein n=1 Tax=Dyella aluminiiresistens TaxID=3069105 RepID=UPI002E790EF9|nr:hypothetical protein [Dyella sp. A6]